MTKAVEDRLKDLYPYPAIRGCRITRMEETRLGRFNLDHSTALRLGTDNVGVFVGNCGPPARALDKLAGLQTDSYPARWLVLSSSRQLASAFFRRQVPHTSGRSRKHAPPYWLAGNTVFTTPEGLRVYGKERGSEDSIAAILLVDPLCHVHKARGPVGRGFVFHDRPQCIVDFRAGCSIDGWLPPFFVLVQHPAKSINTDPMLSPYCLEAWWYLDGECLRTGRPPVDRSVGTSGENTATAAVIELEIDKEAG